MGSAWIRRKHRLTGRNQLRRRFCGPGWRIAHNGVVFTGASSVTVTRYRYRGANIPAPGPPPPTAAEQRARHVESRMRGDTHVRFGGRARETDPGQPGHRARARPNRNDTPGSCPTSDHRWSATQTRVLAPHRVPRVSQFLLIKSRGVVFRGERVIFCSC